MCRPLYRYSEDAMKKCVNEHAMQSDDQFCARCGGPTQPVAHSVPSAKESEEPPVWDSYAPIPAGSAPAPGATPAIRHPLAAPATSPDGSPMDRGRGLGTPKAVLLGSFLIAAAMLISAFVLDGPDEESEYYKQGYSDGYDLDSMSTDASECDTSSPEDFTGERNLTPREIEDYEQGCRDGFEDAK